MTRWIVLGGVLLSACSPTADREPSPSPGEPIGEAAEATTCGVQLAAYPVQGPHNNGYDPTAGDSSQWTCDDANSNSDFGGAHLGNDIWATLGTPVVATVDGTLTLVGWSDYSGNKVTIIDGCGWYHFYCHLDGFGPGIEGANGAPVAAGQVVGYVGKTGTASNGVVHLHYSIYPDGNYNAGVDPWPYLHDVEHGVCGGGSSAVDELVLPLAARFDGSASSDIDGDGAADACARHSGGFTCAKGKGLAFADAVDNVPLSDAEGWSAPQYYQTIRMADLNGDGKADLCARGVSGVGCWLSDGNTFTDPIPGPAWSDANGWGSIQYWSTIRLADIDGDGMADLCARDSSGIICHRSTGKGFEEPIPGPPLSDANGWAAEQFYGTLRFADVDGDGKMDVCARHSAGFACWLSDGKGFPTQIDGPLLSDANGWGDAKYWGTLRMADVDGDGRADLCARHSAGFSCWLSDGKGFPTEVVGPALGDAAGWGDIKYWSTLRVTDIDGDGKADLCGRGGGSFACWLSKGSAFGEAIEGPDMGDDEGWGKPEYYSTFRVSDTNGDGKADVCGRGSGGIMCWPFDGKGFGGVFTGPAWSDANGWADVRYYGTLQIGKACNSQPEVCNGRDDDCDGRVDEDGACDAASSGSGGPSGSSNGPSSAEQASADADGEDGSCSFRARTPPATASWPLLLWAGWSALRRRRRTIRVVARASARTRN